MATALIEKLATRVPAPIFKALHSGQEQFQCPICNYNGPFADIHSFAGPRRHAMCPSCKGLERHRIQYLSLTHVFARLDTKRLKMIHFAPEPFLGRIFSERFGQYETADLFMKGVKHKVDICALPFSDASYDFAFASHILEHITEDRKAVNEIRRILRPHGIAVLPVPIVCAKTVEYPGPNPQEAGHVRAPGVDYFDKYREQFGTVEVYSSESFPQKFQPFVYEDRSCWPTPECPMRLPMQGERHSDYVPVCYA